MECNYKEFQPTEYEKDNTQGIGEYNLEVFYHYTVQIRAKYKDKHNPDQVIREALNHTNKQRNQASDIDTSTDTYPNTNTQQESEVSSKSILLRSIC